MFLGGSLKDRLIWLSRSSMLRLALILSAIFTLGMTITIVVALRLGEEALERRAETSLVALARAAALDGGRGDAFGVILRAPDDLQDLPASFARVAERGGGNVVLEEEFRQSEAWRLLVSVDRAGEPVVAAVPLDDSEDALELLSGILWTTVLANIALSLGVGLGAGALAQRRLRRITETLTALKAGDLAARTGRQRAGDDLDDIARHLDATADALERLVGQTRSLSASIAHDLRTPLARLRAQLEQVPEGAARDAALEEAERLSALFDTIMRVARIEAAQGNVGFEEVALGAFAEHLSEIFGPVIEEAGKRPSVACRAPATVWADRDMLVQAMANLIQNAIRYGGEHITLVVEGRTIGVADDGAGIDPELYGDIIKPMVRLDAARHSDGAGLGLALVRAVADRHGADLTFAPGQPQGLSVMLRFPEG